ncbi:MAG: hypothetical protein NWR67_08965, partial [Saprospiraceae bacterium]|nr:hypothetical protein [Saprospiraceae bacterium]
MLGSKGFTRVYVWNGDAWVQRGLDIDGEAIGDHSGTAVSLSADGNIVAIGAYQNGSNGFDAGHLRVYAWNGSSWMKRGNDIEGDASRDNLGYSVSLSSDGSTIATGAIQQAGGGTGYAKVFDWNGS